MLLVGKIAICFVARKYYPDHLAITITINSLKIRNLTVILLDLLTCSFTGLENLSSVKKLKWGISWFLLSFISDTLTIFDLSYRFLNYFTVCGNSIASCSPSLPTITHFEGKRKHEIHSLMGKFRVPGKVTYIPMVWVAQVTFCKIVIKYW